MSLIASLVYGPAGLTFEREVLCVRAQRVWADALSALGLSTAATLLQTAYSNDLMDPYLLGSLSGALASVAAGVLVFGLYTLASPLVYLIAFFGSLIPGALVSVVALKRGRVYSLIFGISITLALQGLASVLSYLAAAATDLPFLPMLIGTTQYADRSVLSISSIIVMIAFFLSMIIYKRLGLLEYPEGFPRSFGVIEERALAIAVTVSSLASSAVVTCCGILPFLGLIGALVGRKSAPVGSRKSLMIAFLASLITMNLTDLLANSVETPYGFLPVGAFLSLIGGLVLAVTLVRESRGGYG